MYYEAYLLCKRISCEEKWGSNIVILNHIKMISLKESCTITVELTTKLHLFEIIFIGFITIDRLNNLT